MLCKRCKSEGKTHRYFGDKSRENISPTAFGGATWPLPWRRFGDMTLVLLGWRGGGYRCSRFDRFD